MIDRDAVDDAIKPWPERPRITQFTNATENSDPGVLHYVERNVGVAEKTGGEYKSGLSMTATRSSNAPGSPA